MLPIEVFKAYVDSIITNAEAIRSNLVSGASIQASQANASGSNNSIVQALTQQVANLQAQLASAQALATANPGTGGSSDPAIAAENAKLKAEIETLKKAAAAGATSAAPVDDSKIKELEAKLMEYEVIVEDLANLKEYKNENDKLKKEIETLKASAGSTPTPSPAAEPPPAAAAAPTPAPTPEVAATPAPAPAPVEASAPAPTPVAEEPPKAAESAPPIETAPAPAAEPEKAAASPAETEAQLNDLVDKVEAKLEEEPLQAVETPQEELSDQDKALLEEFEKMIGDDKGATPPAP